MSIGLLMTRPSAPSLAVLAQVDDRACERAVAHARHGDQELVRQVDRRGGHALHFIPERRRRARPSGAYGLSAHWAVSKACLADGKTPGRRAGLVPPRPARRRPRRALPRAASGAPGVVRVRLRPRHPRRAAARRPARRVHRRERRRARRRPRRARRAPRRARRPPARAPWAGCRRDRRPRRRAARPGRLRQPRRRPLRAGARRARARRARRPRRRPAHVEGPRDLRAQRGADRQRQAVQRLHAVQDRMARQARRLLPEALPGRAPCGEPRRRAGGDRQRAAEPRPDRLRQDQSRHAQGARRQRRRRGAARGLPAAHRRLRDRARVPGGERAELPRRAPALRDDLDPPRRRRRACARCRSAPRARRRDVAVGAGLARLLPAGAAPHAARRRRELQARVRPRSLRARPPRRRGVSRLVRGTDGLSAGRRGDGADRADRLDAQPAAPADSELSHQGPRHRLAARRGATSRCT